MEPEDWLCQIVDRIAQLGIDIDKTLIWEQPLEWACNYWVEIENLNSESLDKAARVIFGSNDMTERNVLVAARLTLNASGGHVFCHRVNALA